MALTSKYVTVDVATLARIGREIRAYRDRNHLTQSEFALECQRRAARRFPARHLLFSRERISRLENAANTPGVMQALREGELEVIADVLGTSPEALLGLEDPKTSVFYHPGGSDEEAARVGEKVFGYVKAAREVHGWCRWLPSSLETPEFMECHHAALYPPSEVQRWNDIGRLLWAHLRSAERAHQLFNYMFFDDLRAIADGSGIFKTFPKKVRQQQIAELILLVSSPPNVNLILLDEFGSDAARQISTDLQGHDTLAVFDRRALIWRDRSGSTGGSERLSRVGYWRGLLDEFAEASPHKGRDQVLTILEKLQRHTA